MGAPTALALFLGFAVTAVQHADGSDTGSSVIHRHASHSPTAPHHPAHDSGHQHKNCILCQALQAAGPATLPNEIALVLWHGESAKSAAATATTFRILGSPAAYVSRAPPSIG
jgi:hypothetical protein